MTSYARIGLHELEFVLATMDIRVKAIVWAEMVSAGIVPMEASNMGLNAAMEPRFEGLSKEDVRILKRKFRKLWRKKRGRFLHPGEPTPSMMLRRKNEVIRDFCVKAVDQISKTNPDAFALLD